MYVTIMGPDIGSCAYGEPTIKVGSYMSMQSASFVFVSISMG